MKGCQIEEVRGREVGLCQVQVYVDTSISVDINVLKYNLMVTGF